MTNGRLALVRASPALSTMRRSHLRLVEADETDAGFIVALRNDPSLNRHLNAALTGREEQLGWLEAYKQREAAGDEFYFVIVSDGADRGVVRLYDFRIVDGLPSFSWGSWIIPPPPVPGLATYSATLVYEIGFDALRFQQSHFEVRRENRKVIAFHLRSGAHVAHETTEDVFLRFPASAWPDFRTASSWQIDDHGPPGISGDRAEPRG